ncbi:MAG: hypothetical protein Q7S06_00900 [Nanoarchaeota archaeon]|nr:hypothetical protein [Nanoarchaeota archaeon]
MKKEIIKIKRDKYFKARGSQTRILKLRCSHCNKLLFSYQKDGLPGGWLKRCYLNRIISNKKINSTKPLKCCEVIGIPYKYKDGRIAFKLAKGTFKRSYGDPVLK